MQAIPGARSLISNFNIANGSIISSHSNFLNRLDRREGFAMDLSFARYFNNVLKSLFFQKGGKSLFFEMTKISMKGNKFMHAQDELLRQKMISAISRIKSSDLAGNQSGFAALYLLLWFAVIGPH